MGSSIDLIFKIAGVGILVAVLNAILKHAGKEEQGHIVTWQAWPLSLCG